MDTFNFEFETDSTLTNDTTTSTNSNLDWTAFQSASTSIEHPPPLILPSITIHQNPFSPNWLAQQDDAVAPDHRTKLNSTTTHVHDDGLYFEIERFFNGLNQQESQTQQQDVIQIPDQINHNETSVRNRKFSISIFSFFRYQKYFSIELKDHYQHHYYPVYHHHRHHHRRRHRHHHHHHVLNIIINYLNMLLN